MSVKKLEVAITPDGNIGNVHIEFGRSLIPGMCKGCRYAEENPDDRYRDHTCKRPIKKRMPLLRNYAWSIYNKSLELLDALESGDSGQVTDSADELQNLKDEFQDEIDFAWERLAVGASRPGGGMYKWCHSQNQDEIEKRRKARKEKEKNV